jgi:hypothetical protein
VGKRAPICLKVRYSRRKWIAIFNFGCVGSSSKLEKMLDQN